MPDAAYRQNSFQLNVLYLQCSLVVRHVSHIVYTLDPEGLRSESGGLLASLLSALSACRDTVKQNAVASVETGAAAYRALSESYGKLLNMEVLLDKECRQALKHVGILVKQLDGMYEAEDEKDLEMPTFLRTFCQAQDKKGLAKQ